VSLVSGIEGHLC